MSHTGTGHIRFVVVHDFHHQDAFCDPWMAALFHQVSQTPEVDFCFGLGDLADGGKRESLETMTRLAKSTGLPFYVTPGNHDLDLSPVDGWFEAVFPGQRNYTFTRNGWQFVVIDTTEGTRYEDVTIAGTTLAWLEATRPRLDAHAPTVLATHFPLASEVKFCPRNAQAVLDRLTGLNVRTIFSGHYHGRTSHWRGAIEFVTNVCVSRVRKNHDDSPTKGYWVVDGAPSGQLIRTFVPFAGVA